MQPRVIFFTKKVNVSSAFSEEYIMNDLDFIFEPDLSKCAFSEKTVGFKGWLNC